MKAVAINGSPRNAILMMIKIAEGDSFESNHSLIKELTFDNLNKEIERRNLEFSQVQNKILRVTTAKNFQMY